MISYIVGIAFNLLFYTIFIYILLSWFVRDQTGPVFQIYTTLGTIAEPILAPFRNLMGRFSGGRMGVDFSPVIALVVLSALRNIIVTALRSMGL